MTVKSLTTSYKIIKILKLLTEKPMGVNEILKELEDDDSFVNKETISKYFTILRFAGCEIKKRRNKFYIKYPFLQFTKTELKTMADFQKAVKDLDSKENYQTFLKLTEKLFALIDNETEENYKKVFQTTDLRKTQNKTCAALNFKDKIETISKFMGITPQIMKISYKNNTFTVVPLKFIYTKAAVNLLGYDTKENINKNFNLKYIENIKSLPLKSPSTNFGFATTFKVVGRLKNSYTLKEGETAQTEEDCLIVTNNYQDKTELFNRLLKYGANCEILYPKSDREKLTEMAKKLAKI